MASWVGGRILVCGAGNNTEEDNKCWTYQADRDQWREVGSLNTERHFSSVAAKAQRRGCWQ